MNKQIERTDVEQIQEDTASPEVEVNAGSGDASIGGAEQLQAEIGSMASDFRMGGFKCVHQECGLVHNHDTTKHRGSDSFDMSDDEAAQMEANPNCHCGLNEVARTGVEGAPSPSKANRQAPIPDTMTRHLESKF